MIQLWPLGQNSELQNLSQEPLSPRPTFSQAHDGMPQGHCMAQQDLGRRRRGQEEEPVAREDQARPAPPMGV